MLPSNDDCKKELIELIENAFCKMLENYMPVFAGSIREYIETGYIAEGVARNMGELLAITGGELKFQNIAGQMVVTVRTRNGMNYAARI